MKILVLSDSHSGLSFMRQAIRAVKPDQVIHLGDYFGDGQVMAEENPHMVFHQVPGNCDRYRMQTVQPETLCYPIGGVMMYMTHGHLHRVKFSTAFLLASARQSGAAIALYGHTHEADCRREPDGLWVLNPGSCSGGHGSVGLIEIQNAEIIRCRILTLAELEELS